MKQHLKNLVSKGETKRAIAELLDLTAVHTDLHNQVIGLSARFSVYEKQKLERVENPTILAVELNSINQALLIAIDALVLPNEPEKSNFDSSNMLKTSILKNEISQLLEMNEIDKVFEEIEKMNVKNKFLYNRLKQEYIAGLSGIQLLDWIQRMKVFIASF